MHPWLIFKSRFQVLASSAAHSQLSAVLEQYDVIAIEVGMHFLDPVEIHDDRAVNANESRRIEPSFKVVHLLA